MEYIVILDPGQRDFSAIETSHSFLEKFSSYDLAKQEAETWKENGDCKEYAIYGLCTDSCNHIV